MSLLPTRWHSNTTALAKTLAREADEHSVRSNPLCLNGGRYRSAEGTTMVSINDQSFRFRTHPIGTVASLRH
ncbi:MAG: hypothetical protein R3C28_19160 [Pirellulaceae bacterium]